jgi:hypothetical protein
MLPNQAGGLGRADHLAGVLPREAFVQPARCVERGAEQKVGKLVIGLVVSWSWGPRCRAGQHAGSGTPRRRPRGAPRRRCHRRSSSVSRTRRISMRAGAAGRAGLSDAGAGAGGAIGEARGLAVETGGGADRVASA